MKTFMARLAAPLIWIYNKTHWFTDKEAWGVYRFAAFVEAGFWGFFILTVAYDFLGLPEAPSVVAFGRSLLGTAYGVYAIFVLISARSMEWRAGRVTVALLAGAVPFGSIAFERVLRAQRRKYPPRVQPPVETEAT